MKKKENFTLWLHREEVGIADEVSQPITAAMLHHPRPVRAAQSLLLY